MEEQNQELSTEENLVRSMEVSQREGGKPILTVILAVLITLAGLFTGYFLTKTSTSSQQEKTQAALPSSKEKIKKGEVYGIDKPDVYPDSATGILKVNDKSITDEGSHVLIRNENDPSQNAYLTSTVLDLNLFLDREVEVWGETFAAQKAGWLMDVGRVKVIN